MTREVRQVDRSELELTRRDVMTSSAVAAAGAVGISAAQSGGPSDEISGTVEDTDGNAVDGATVVAVPHDETLDPLVTTTDANGEYAFEHTDLHEETNLYHVVARDGTESDPIRSQQNYPFVPAFGEPPTPDSIVHQYPVEDFSSGSWPDSVGTSDISTVSVQGVDGDAFGGTGGVSADGSDDYAQSDTMGTFGSQMDTDFAVAIAFSQTSAGYSGVSGMGPAFGSDQSMGGEDNDFFAFRMMDADGDYQIARETTGRIDGGEYVVIVNKTGNSASDIELWWGPSTEESVVSVSSGAFDNVTDLNEPMTYFARSSGGSLGAYNDQTLGDMYWFNDSLDSTERRWVFSQYDWYNP